ATGIPENTDEHVERTENDSEAGSRVTDLPSVATNMSGTHTYGDIRFNATEKASDEDISPMNDGGDGNYDKTGGNMKKSEIPSQAASWVRDQKPNESSRETAGDVEMMEESDADEDATGIPENTDEHVERTENDNEVGWRVTDLPTGM
ncbi:hypothetical protein D915_010111, partial [Fasciola hepatica]